MEIQAVYIPSDLEPDIWAQRYADPLHQDQATSEEKIRACQDKARQLAFSRNQNVWILWKRYRAMLLQI